MTHEIDDDDVSGDLRGDYLSPTDFDDGIGRRFTIASVAKHLYEGKNGKPAEQKRVLTFDDGHCLGLNKTNLRLLAKWYGTRASAWVGKDVTVYRDESVQYAGRLVGGWRLRRPSVHDLSGMASEPVPF